MSISNEVVKFIAEIELDAQDRENFLQGLKECDKECSDLNTNRHSQIFELKSQNRNLNQILCEIFTYLTVKIPKSGIQRILVWLCKLVLISTFTYYIILYYMIG